MKVDGFFVNPDLVCALLPWWEYSENTWDGSLTSHVEGTRIRFVGGPCQDRYGDLEHNEIYIKDRTVDQVVAILEGGESC